MDLFDIIGPIMIGPSSSHTAGVVRIGNIVRKMLNSSPSEILVKFHGSFAATYKGHGSDKAIIGGLLGFKPDDPRIRDSLKIADDIGVPYRFETIELNNAHPNTLIVSISGENDIEMCVVAESIGGGNIIIRKIDDIDVELSGEYDTLITNHKDESGVISLVTSILAIKQINIANMRVFRPAKGKNAIMIIETDGKLDKSLSAIVSALPNIDRASIIPGGNS